ncbi:MAG: prepilin-type N-terminal cleavage/methylation domain-containing protein [Verrucomicrobiae bacterium]|nr:prepilin-type N-terminal cleavage/methylation domain-containing protein [Verrucomicrobiae bacterium]
MNKNRLGFTFTELLVVLLVIGVLAGSTAVIGHNSEEREEAIKIVSNLRSLRTAALDYYMENMSSFRDSIALPAGEADENGNYIHLLDPYLSQQMASVKENPSWIAHGIFSFFTALAHASDSAGYYFKVIQGSGTSDWYVYYAFSSGTDGVKKTIAELAEKESDLEGEEKGKPFSKNDSSIRLFVLSNTRSTGGAGGEEEEEECECNPPIPGALTYVSGRNYPQGALVKDNNKYYVRYGNGNGQTPGKNGWTEWVGYPDALPPLWKPRSEGEGNKYFAGDMVCYEHVLYITKNAQPNPVPGENPKDNPSDWKSISNLWDRNYSYYENDVLLHGGKEYRSKSNSNKNHNPSTSSFYWIEL